MKRLTGIVARCILVALWTGCASSPPSHFYTLSPASKPAAATAENYSVSVGPVTIPAAVDRPQIVVRVGPNQVDIDEFNRWASPLQSDIARVVAENLVLMLGTPAVTLFPQTTAAGASYRVVISVLRFDSVSGGAATLDAVWTVRQAMKDQPRTGRTTLSVPTQGSGYSPLVAAHSLALEKLSADVAEAIRTMEKSRM
ncbi:MAG TPA: PqiC family protein [Bacteroidota bacterium]|nr:PqiC family protein [Bacteroidota bacterium]